MGNRTLLEKFHPEAHIDGFTVNDSAIAFYSLVHAIKLQEHVTDILDFGAGRGAHWFINTKTRGSLLRRHLRDLRGEGVVVTACDVESAVFEHPCSDRQIKIQVGNPLPFDDETFDLIVTDCVVEHLERPREVCNELIRVLKPGGQICIRTPSKWSYVALAATLVPNRLHVKFLSKIQPNRIGVDVFPTYYRMNSIRSLRRLFDGHQVHVTKFFGDPEYHFNSSLIFRCVELLHWVLPRALAPQLFAFVRKA